MAEEPVSHLVEERKAKVAALRAEGVEPFPWSYPGRVPTSVVVEVARQLPQGEVSTGAPLRVAGRVGAIRTHGKTSFVDLADRSGPLQLFIRVDELGENDYARWLKRLDPGDLVGADGFPALTRRGEPSLRVSSLTLLAKAIRPPPEKFHGLKDPEERLRRRYVDLLASAESRGRFMARSHAVREIRSYFDLHGFLEVETSILTPSATGGLAEPFATRSNYLGTELKLRIALELSLKRLLVGGLERVYEIGKVFRNEDLDVTHSPEFTMLEAYWAYADYTDMRKLVEGLYARLAERVAEWLPESPSAKEAPNIFHPPFASVDYVHELESRSGISDVLSKDRDELRRLARGVGATVADEAPTGKFLEKLFEHYVEPALDKPTFVLDFPTATTPLAKRHRSLPGRVERFELFYRGFELANAYTELNDPAEQAARFQEQVSGRADDSYAYDAEFVEALEYGMPPATGIGIGIDRALMALLGVSSIKDVILFIPQRERANPSGPA